MVYEEIIAVLGLVGIGGIVATSLTYVYEKRKQIKFSEQEEKEKRYKALAIQMRIVVEPENIKYVKRHRPDLETIEDWKNEVRAEWFNLLLFASDDVVKALKEFILKPNNATYAKTVIAMRKDLWNKKTTLRPEEINL